MDKRSTSIVLPAALLLCLWLCLIATRMASTASAQPAGPEVTGAQVLGLVVTATVGIEPDVCSSTPRIRVGPGTRVFYCYRATNTGQVALTVHTVEDGQSGIIWDRKTLNLPPGETVTTVDEGLELSAVADAGMENQVRWVARAVTPTLSVSATAEATVFVVGADVSVNKGAGVAGSPCVAGAEAVVPEEGNAGFCVVVENTGAVPLVSHRVTDPLLALDAEFDYTLPPSERLTITHDLLAELGVDGSLIRTNVTRSVVNQVFYTGTSPADAAATGPASASGEATVTVGLAEAGIRFTATVGTDPVTCAQAKNLNLTSANTEFYYCAILHNTGNIALTEHALWQRGRDLVTEFALALEPGDIVSVTNNVLADLGQPQDMGPMTVRDQSNLQLSNIFVYTGTTTLRTGVDDETRGYTRTASVSTFAGVASTPSPTATPTNTPRSSSSQATNTPRPRATATWTPVSPLPTPEAAQAPTATPTPTRSYQISLLETPTSQPASPLVLPAAAVAATQDAAATLLALDATSTAGASSPLATPTPLPLSPIDLPTDTLLASAVPVATITEAAVLVVTATPPVPTQRPVVLPPPAPTPDALLFAAQTVDAMAMTALWIWVLVGTLVFFVVAGVLVGLSFRENERTRFDLVDAGLVEEYEFLLPPPAEDESRAGGDDEGLDRLP